MKIKVEMLTEQKIIDVEPGFLVGSPGRVRVDVCLKCGAVIFDPLRHDDWHRAHESREKSEERMADRQIAARR